MSDEEDDVEDEEEPVAVDDEEELCTGEAWATVQGLLLYEPAKDRRVTAHFTTFFEMISSISRSVSGNAKRAARLMQVRVSSLAVVRNRARHAE